MREELYIEKKNELHKLDTYEGFYLPLYVPNILYSPIGTISSIYSEEFTLPLSNKNIELLNISSLKSPKTDSSTGSNILTCSYSKNGVIILQEMHLIILSMDASSITCSVSKCHNELLNFIKSDGKTLPELIETVLDDDSNRYNLSDLPNDISTFDNRPLLQRPVYNCGYCYTLFKWDGTDGKSLDLSRLEIEMSADQLTPHSYPCGCLSVKSLTDIIMSYYGIDCELIAAATDLKRDAKYEGQEILSHGILTLSDTQYDRSSEHACYVRKVSLLNKIYKDYFANETLKNSKIETMLIPEVISSPSSSPYLRPYTEIFIESKTKLYDRLIGFSYRNTSVHLTGRIEVTCESYTDRKLYLYRMSSSFSQTSGIQTLFPYSITKNGSLYTLLYLIDLTLNSDIYGSDGKDWVNCIFFVRGDFGNPLYLHVSGKYSVTLSEESPLMLPIIISQSISDITAYDFLMSLSAISESVYFERDGTLELISLGKILDNATNGIFADLSKNVQENLLSYDFNISYPSSINHVSMGPPTLTHDKSQSFHPNINTYTTNTNRKNGTNPSNSNNYEYISPYYPGMHTRYNQVIGYEESFDYWLYDPSTGRLKTQKRPVRFMVAYSPMLIKKIQNKDGSTDYQLDSQSILYSCKPLDKIPVRLRERLLNRGFTVSVLMKLSLSEVNDIDMLKPIYLEQTNQYYGLTGYLNRGNNLYEMYLYPLY